VTARPALLVAALLVTGVLGACGGGDDGEVVVDIEDSGTTVEMTADQTLEIRLFESPSTGYTWQWVDGPDGAVLVAAGEEFEEEEPVQPGSGGTRIWRWESVGPGETSMSMVERFGDDDETISATFDLTVVVEDG
jgi:predicted secreted protein